LDVEQREYIDLVKSSGESLLRIINDILDFSKMEAGRLDLECVDFSLRNSVGESLRALGVRAHGKGLELACQISPDVLDSLCGDPDRLRQILVNLVGNAIKFSDSGEVVVRIQSESKSADHVRLHFSVSDQGIGIPAEKQDLIFAPFVQADGS